MKDYRKTRKSKRVKKVLSLITYRQMPHDEAYEYIADTADRIDGLIANLENHFMPADLHVKCLKGILPELASNLKRAFIALKEENPWEDSPFDVKES